MPTRPQSVGEKTAILGWRKKARISHENLVRDRIYRQRMGPIVSMYLVQDAI